MTDSFDTDAQWLPKTSAGELVGVSHTTVRRWGLAGSVAERIGDDGTTLYSVADCKRMATSGGADIATPQGAMTALFRASVDLLRQAERHNQQLLEPNRKVLSLLSKENDRIAKQNNSLRRNLERMQDAHEKSRSLEHERLMAQSQFEASQKMQAEMFRAGVEYVPLLGQVVLSRFAAKGGGDGPETGAAIAESAVLRIVAGMTDGQMSTMRESGAVNDAELMMLTELRRRVREAMAKANGESPEPEHECKCEPSSTTEGESDDGEEVESEETTAS